MGTFQSDKDRYVGNAKLKRFTRGTLATDKPLSLLDKKIFMLFAKGITMKRVQTALQQDKIVLEEQELFDILRKVGYEYQTYYRKNVANPFNKDQLMFADFVKGYALNQLCESNGLDPKGLITNLRKTALLYFTYQQLKK